MCLGLGTDGCGAVLGEVGDAGTLADTEEVLQIEEGEVGTDGNGQQGAHPFRGLERSPAAHVYDTRYRPDVESHYNDRHRRQS